MCRNATSCQGPASQFERRESALHAERALRECTAGLCVAMGAMTGRRNWVLAAHTATLIEI